MGFVPNTTITLYKGVPLDNSYENTLYFSSVASQTNYFSSLLATVVLNENYRVEPNRVSIKVQMPYAIVFNCNYMRFKNTSYENKWFYAFITAVDYVNEETSLITYEIDVMQTWLPNIDYELEQCFVEREHSDSDVIGYNVVNEDIPEGETVMNGSTEVIGLNSTGKDYYYIVAIASKDDAGNQVFDHLYTPARLYAYTENQVTDMADFINSFSDAPEKVLSVYVCPSSLVGQVDAATHLITMQGIGKFVTLNGISSDTTIDGYTPRNKKLLTYPYNYLKVVAPDTSCLVLRYELFKANGEPDYYNRLDPHFTLAGNITQPVQVVLRPYAYKNSAIQPEFMQEKLSIVNFPTCAWSTDAFKEYLTNNLSKQIVPSLMAVAGSTAAGVQKGAAIGFPEMGIVTGAATLVGVAGKLAVDTAVAAHHDVRVSGVSESSSADFARSWCNFYGYRMSVRRDRARQIDNYFQMYGYASNEIKVPFIHSRQKWTYTKTVGCNLMSSKMPTEDMRKVEDIFDAGVRFWSDHSSIGNYDQSNPVLSSVN